MYGCMVEWEAVNSYWEDMEYSGKFEELFQLALEMPPDLRDKSPILSSGFQEKENIWEVIIKYHGDVNRIREQGIEVEELIAGYAILHITRQGIARLGDMEEIEYVELPKEYFATAITPMEAVDGARVTKRPPYLTGKGVLLAVIDSGVDYRRREFRGRDGSTRILYYWDQSQEDGYYTSEDLNRILEQEISDDESMGPGRNRSGHGTAVMGIAAGCDYEGDYRGIAVEASLLVVALGSRRADRNTGYSTDIMRAVKFALEKAEEARMPLIINLSYGNTFGPHNGSSLLERYLDQTAEIGRTSIFVGAGNEGSGAGHYRGRVRMGEQKRIAFSVGAYEKNVTLQLWKYPGDRMMLQLETPEGNIISISREQFGKGGSLLFSDWNLIVMIGEATPYQCIQEVYLELQGRGGAVPEGVWHVLLRGERIQNGRVDAYMQNALARNDGTTFLEPEPTLTLTCPATAERVITVGAYDPITESYADFSGRGEMREWEESVFENISVKPDFVAAGVNLLTPYGEWGYETVSGSSFSTPLAAGCGALLMEWGIVRNNDPFMYGEKLKAKMRESTEKLRNMKMRPDDKNGYGGFKIFDDFVENI